MNEDMRKDLLSGLRGMLEMINVQIQHAINEKPEYVQSVYELKDASGRYMMVDILAARTTIYSKIVELEMLAPDIKLLDTNDEPMPDSLEQDFEDIRKGLRENIRDTMRGHYKMSGGQACFCGWQFRVWGGGFAGHYADVIVESGIFDPFLPTLNADAPTN